MEASNIKDNEKVLGIATYFLYLNEQNARQSQIDIEESEQEAPDEVTILKLIKLVYYANALSMVYLKRPLFQETIEAWKHGPVIPSLYRKLKSYEEQKKQNLMLNEKLRENDKYWEYLTQEEKEIIAMTFREYGGYTAFKLRDMTHQETPYVEHYRENANNPIPNNEIAKYFKAIQQQKAQSLYEKSKKYQCLFS